MHYVRQVIYSEISQCLVQFFLFSKLLVNASNFEKRKTEHDIEIFARFNDDLPYIKIIENRFVVYVRRYISL